MGRIWWGLLRFGFRLLYREMAWSYDLVSWIASLGRWRDWQQVAMRYARGPRVLDLAFGTGNLMLDWHAAGLRPVGVDLSPQMVRIAATKMRALGLPLTLARACAQALPFADATFDGVVCTFPAEFIWGDETAVEVSRVLRPGGRFVVVLGASLTGRDPLSRFIEWLYSITGQRPPLPGSAVLPPSGELSVQWEKVHGEGWVATVLVGEKQLEQERKVIRSDAGQPGLPPLATT